MKSNAHSGWLMSLRDDPWSNWGGVERFLQAVLESRTSDGNYLLKSEVWGRTNVKDLLPQKGQGIGFYHSTRALFPRRDKFGRKPRLTLLGELVEVVVDGREVVYIEACVNKDVMEAMSKHPIVRDESTSHLFEGCGIKPGPVATFYYADPEHWKQIIDRVEQPMSRF